MIAITLLAALLHQASDNLKPALGCNLISSVAIVEAQSYYKDSRASILDKRLKEENDVKLSSIREALGNVYKGIDRALRGNDHSKAECSLHQLKLWAEKNALEGSPTALQGVYQRSRFVLAFALSSIKARQLSPSFSMSEVDQWLNRLAEADAQIFLSRPKLRNNLYYWAGAEAAAVSLLTGSRKLAEFSDRVWAEAMLTAGPEGAFPQEITRGQRAVVYQLHATNALVVLDNLRRTRGAAVRESELEAWEKILTFTYAVLCDPSLVHSSTGIHQEHVDQRSLTLLHSLGAYLPSQPPSCVEKSENALYPDLGGDVALTAKAIDAFAARK